MGAEDRRRALVAGDLAVLAAVTVLALRLGAVRSGWAWSASFLVGHAAWTATLVAMWVALAWANGLYDRRRAPDRWMAAVLSAQVSAQLLLVWAVAYFIPPPWTLVRHVVVFFAAGAAVAMPLWRQGYAAIFSRGAFRRRVMIVGAGSAGRAVLEAIRAAPHEFEVVGFADDGAEKARRTIDGVAVVASRGDLVARALDLGATDLVLAITRDMHRAVFAAIMDAREQGIVVTPMPVFYESVTGRVPVEHIGDQWAVALPLDPPESRGLYRFARRVVDICAGAAGTLVLAVLLPILAPAIRGTSRGGVFYRQTRLGRGGRPFTLLKLRTMVLGAEADGPRWAAPSDPRATPLGRWLRRARLDELPQCLNLLRGDMSLVGPRPERPEFVEGLAARIPFYRARHAVRPGLTGWATIHQGYAGSEQDALVKLQYDLYYIKHQSVLLDAYILARTVTTVLRLAGR